MRFPSTTKKAWTVAAVVFATTLAPTAASFAEENGGLDRRRAPVLQPGDSRGGTGIEVPNPAGNVVPIDPPSPGRGRRTPPIYTPLATEDEFSGLHAWMRNSWWFKLVSRD